MVGAIDLRRDSSLVCHSERNEESFVWLTRFLVSLGMTKERLSALSRFKWVAYGGYRYLSLTVLMQNAKYIRNRSGKNPTGYHNLSSWVLFALIF